MILKDLRIVGRAHRFGKISRGHFFVVVYSTLSRRTLIYYEGKIQHLCSTQCIAHEWWDPYNSAGASTTDLPGHGAHRGGVRSVAFQTTVLVNDYFYRVRVLSCQDQSVARADISSKHQFPQSGCPLCFMSPVRDRKT